MNKLLTIIIPTYNMEDYLKNCLSSLLIPENKLPLLEVLVINDGSKDRSSVIAHEFEEKYSQTFKVIDKENGNYGSCINVGLKNATGKYVKILDADDTYDTSNFSGFIDYLKLANGDLIVTDYDTVDNNGKIINHFSYNLENHKLYDFNSFLENNPNFSFQMHAVTYKKEIFEGLNYHQTEGVSYTDYEWVFVPLIKVKTLSYCQITIYKYLLGREGQTVDLITYYKKVADRQKGAVNMLNVYSTIPEELLLKKNLYSKLEARIIQIYRSYLFTNINKSAKPLIEFDTYLKSSFLDIYNKLDSIKLYRMFSIHKFRKLHFKVPFWLKVYLKIRFDIKEQ